MNEWYSQWTPLLNKIHVLNINMILITWNEYPNQPNSDHRICIFSFHIEFNTREEEEEEIVSDIILLSCLTKERKWTKMFLIITTNLLVGRYTYWIVYLFFFLLITAVSVLKCIQIDKNERINRQIVEQLHFIESNMMMFKWSTFLMGWWRFHLFNHKDNNHSLYDVGIDKDEHHSFSQFNVQYRSSVFFM